MIYINSAIQKIRELDNQGSNTSNFILFILGGDESNVFFFLFSISLLLQCSSYITLLAVNVAFT